MKIGLLDTKVYEKVRKKLIEGEEELGVIRKHPFFLMRGLFFTAIFLLVTFLIFLIIRYIIQIFDYGEIFNYVFLVFIILIFSYKFLTLFIDYKFDFLVGTNFRILVYNHDFIFYSNYRPISFYQIEEISFVQQGILQTIFKYGHVEISIKGKGDTNTIIYDYAQDSDIIVDKLSSAHAEILKSGSNKKRELIEQFQEESGEFIHRSNPINKIDDDISDKIADIFEETVKN